MIIIDYRDKRPLYEQVAEKLKALIVSQVLPPGEKMPSVRNLAVDLSINPNTIQRAYAQLEQDGYIYTIAGRGNFVSEPENWKQGHLDNLRSDLEGALRQARDGGLPGEEAMELCRKIYEDGGEDS